MKTKLFIIFFILFQSQIFGQDKIEKNKNQELFEAIRKSNIDKVLDLLKSGVNVNSRDRKSLGTPLMLAITLNRNEIVKLLLEQPEIQVNVSKLWGGGQYTPLMLALLFNKKEIVELLLKRPEIDINIKDEKGWSALRYAARTNQKEIYNLLIKDPRIKVSNTESIINQILLISQGNYSLLWILVFLLILIAIFIVGIFINSIKLKRWFGTSFLKSVLINLGICFISTALFSVNFYLAAMFANDLGGKIFAIGLHLDMILLITSYILSFILSYNLLNYYFVLTNQQKIHNFLIIRISIIAILTTILWLAADKVFGLFGLY